MIDNQVLSYAESTKMFSSPAISSTSSFLTPVRISTGEFSVETCDNVSPHRASPIAVNSPERPQVQMNSIQLSQTHYSTESTMEACSVLDGLSVSETPTSSTCQRNGGDGTYHMCAKTSVNPFFNLLRLYRLLPVGRGKSACQMSIDGARIWRAMTSEEKEPFRRIAMHESRRRRKQIPTSSRSQKKKSRSPRILVHKPTIRKQRIRLVSRSRTI